MLNEANRVQDLFRKYIDGSATVAELDELEAYLQSEKNNDTFQALLANELENTQPASMYDEERWTTVMKRFLPDESLALQTTERKRRSLFARVAVAAAIVISAGAGVYYYQHSKPATATTPMISKFGNDKLPGGNKATLTLANGSVIVLDTARNGVLTAQNGISIKKLSNGQLLYDASNAVNANGENAFNTIATPRGGQYQLILPDGSKVWLNAASTLRFPVAFNNKERKVTLTGEAYFEIAANAKAPFKVDTKTAEVNVLGTSFNINAYDNEAAEKTTLIEGSVRVNLQHGAVLLQPGKQLQYIKTTKQLTVNTNVDVDKVLAWKNGEFQFTGADIATIMREVERWYDVDVVLEGNISTEKFVGMIPRNMKLSQFLEVLALNDVHFKIEEKKLIVTP